MIHCKIGYSDNFYKKVTVGNAIYVHASRQGFNILVRVNKDTYSVIVLLGWLEAL